MDSGEPEGEADFAAVGVLDAFEGDLENELRFNGADGAESSGDVFPDKLVNFLDFFVGKSGVSLGDDHEFLLVPDGEGVV